MSVYTNNIVIHTGTDFEQVFVLEDDSGPFELGGYTGVCKFKKTSRSLTSNSFEVVIADPNGGRVRVSMASTVTRDLTPGRYLYDLLLYRNGENTKVIEGEVIVKKSVTR